MFRILEGDVIEQLKTLADASVDSIVTDPPYELGFMGKAWDATGIASSASMWGDALRVLKPGGYLLAFGGARTYHRMASAIEDTGFEIRDQIMWIYGSGLRPMRRCSTSRLAKKEGRRKRDDSRTRNAGDDGLPDCGRKSASYQAAGAGSAQRRIELFFGQRVDGGRGQNHGDSLPLLA